MKLNHLRPHEFQMAIREGWPLLVPAGCVEHHGPHLPLGLDTLLAEYLLERVAQRSECVVAPALAYGPTGYAVSGPDQGTVDVSTERFGRHAKDVLAGFWDNGFRWIIVAEHHQQLDGPEALAIRQAAAEVTFERSHAARGDAWWGKAPLPAGDNVFERIRVWPCVLPQAAEAAQIVMADHAGYYETSLLLAAHPELVEMEQLAGELPWYCEAPESRARQASAEAGAAMWEAMVEAWVAKLATLRPPRRPTPEDMTITGLF